MNEEIDIILESTSEAMQGSVAYLEKSLLNIRAGKASPQMLGSVFVDYYGSQTPLSQVANVNTPDSRTITIQPWEKKMLSTIEKAIMVANLGFNPMNNGELIIKVNIARWLKIRPKVEFMLRFIFSGKTVRFLTILPKRLSI